jgi:hypothetical protein
MNSKLLLVCFLLLSSYVSFGQQITNCPCCVDENRQFDFWVGEWKAFTAKGLAGTNSIVIMEDSCVIQENWKSAAGNYSGTSYNYYDRTDKKWKQLWIDNQGGSLELSGNFTDGKMVLQSQEKYSEQNKVHFTDRITWTPNNDGTVRQHWQRTTDGGKTWTDIFDGTYKRVKK